MTVPARSVTPLRAGPTRRTEAEKMKKLMLILALGALAGCNTVDGIGRDISGGAMRVSGWLG
ncbi:hypothetical protein GCM10011452_05430 [Gemmobacter lanyuensis]|uniref:Entericidin EcnA/B family protein n=1 Tax=Gemmobacter lanyuensis TaxID=1054497 RepID=A0A918MHF4_9RHOB|nr:hypothetical protein GCM10011452_05430 [Gemmobacter lanyuensis]